MAHEPLVKKSRSEHRGTAALREHMRSSWPKDLFPNDTVVGEASFQLCVEHDAPHDNCALEWWNVHGRVGENHRFGVFVTFVRLAATTSESLPPVCDVVKYAAGVAWVIVDHEEKKYYRFVEDDCHAPLIAAFLTANTKLTGSEPFLQALAEQFKHGCLPLPERIMTEAASVNLGRLGVKYGKNHISLVSLAEGGKLSPPSYKLSLSGTTFETGDTQMREEVRATVELTFKPVQRPVLHGNSGVVELGNDWRHDIFYYFLPHCRVAEGTIHLSRASDDLEIARSNSMEGGRVWMGHGFGHALPQTVGESSFLDKKSQKGSDVLLCMWNCCSIQLYNETEDIVSIIYAANPENWKPLKVYTVYQCGATGKSEEYHKGVEIIVDSSSQFRSDMTGVLFPTRWTLNTPFRADSKLELTLEATFADQEFVALAAQPSLWLGTVQVRGKIIASDGSSKGITGDGFMNCRGKGNFDDISGLFEILREVTTTRMEKPEVSSITSLEEIVYGPAASAMGIVRRLMSLRNQTFSNAYWVVFAAFLAAYGYIFHRGSEKKEVLKALRWIHGKWLSYFGSSFLDIKTLTLRAFMFCELTTVLQKCCTSWIPSYVQPLDLVMSPPRSMDVLVAARKLEISSTTPPRVRFETGVGKLDTVQLKAMFNGRWTLDKSRGTGNIGVFLAAQGVNVMWRSFIDNVSCTLSISVDEAKRTACVFVETPLYNKKHLIRLDGVLWEWSSTGRGVVHSRASVLPGGTGIYMETTLQNKMMECKWYTFEDAGRSMVVWLKLYRNNALDKDDASVPLISVCARYFTLCMDDCVN